MGRYLEDFRVGEVIKHWPGRTVRDFDDTWFTLLTMNTNPLHLDEHFASQSQHGRWLVNATPDHCSSTEGGPRMRTRMLVLGCLAAALAATGLVGGTAARADEEAKAPPDPTRGQWDSFLDPLRDFEDNYVSGGQKAVEDATKIHLFGGLTEAYTWDFNRPRSGSLIALHSLEHHND